MKSFLRRLFAKHPANEPKLRSTGRRPRQRLGWLEELEGRMLLNGHPLGEVPHHVHAHVQIFVNGTNVIIPPGVNIPQTHAPEFPGVPSSVALGVVGTDENAHTHSDDGILHLDEGSQTGTGTVSNTANSTSVVGTGTAFTTELRVGQFLTIGSTTVKVVAIADATHLTVQNAIVSANSNSTYSISFFVNLATFFTDWGGIFSATELKVPTAYGSDGHPTAFSDNVTDPTHTIRLFVNGAASTDLQNYEPEDGDQIIISYETIPGATAPRLNPINNVTMPSNPGANAPARTFYVPLDGSDPTLTALTYTATVSPNNSQLTVQVIPPTSSTGTNPILRLNVTGRDIEGNNFTGDLTFELFHDVAPTTVDQIMQQVNQGFYTNLTFHRVVNDFMAQGGSRTGDGAADPTVPDFSDEFSSQAMFTGFGQLAMANGGDDTNDTQFFATDSNLSLVFNASSSNEDPPVSLNFNHTIFGQMISGFDTFNKLMLTPVHNNNGVPPEKSVPDTTVRINTASIVTDNQHAMLKLTVPHDFTATSITTAPVVTVTASNGTLTAQRSFVVNAVSDTTNDRAFLGTIAPQATTVNTPVTFTLPATDLEGDTLTYEAGDSSNPANLPAGAQSVNINQATGTVTVTPTTGFQGTITLKVGVRDQTDRSTPAGFQQSDFDTQIITIPVGVNNAPTADNQNVPVGFGTSIPITLVGADGDSPAVQTLTFRVQTLPQRGTLKDSAGNAVTVGTALPSAMVTYTPTYTANDKFTGADSFTLDVKDTGGTASGGDDTSDIATVNITVSPNQAPAADPQSVGTTLNTAKTITLTGGDGDAGVTQTLTFRIRTLPTQGTLTDSSTHVILASDLGANGFTLPTTTLTYTPTAGIAGSDNFTFDVMDDGGTDNGGVNTDLTPATVAVNVTANQKPTAATQTVTTHADVAKTITLNGGDGDATVTQTLTFRIRSLPTNGTLTDSNSHEIVAGDLGANGYALPNATVTYTPDHNGTGTETFTFDVKDNGGTSGGGVDTSDPATVTINVADATKAGVELHDGELAISGDKEDNTIDVSLNAAGDMIEVTIDGDVQSFDLADVHMIQLHGHGGDDDITIDPDITVPAHIRGGKGNDVITAGGGDSTIRGGRGNDDITGGDANDVIYGRQGNDTIDAGEGDNKVHGGKGNDSITAGAGNDIIWGGIGNDSIDAGDGDDTIHGRAGNDSLLGGAGNDKIFAGMGDDSVNGGDGDDTMHGGKGTDTDLDPDASDTLFDIP